MKKKKVLILAYDFPPYNSIGGQRPFSWYRYLSEFGYEPVVVTRHWSADVQSAEDCVKPTIKKDVEKEDAVYGTIYRVPFTPNLRDKTLLKYGLNKKVFIRKGLSIFYKLVEFSIPFFDAKRGLYTCAESVCKEHEIDFVIASGEPFILFKYASLLSKKFSIPWIADYRDGWSTGYSLSKLDKLLYDKLERGIVVSAKGITTASNEYEKQLNQFLYKKAQVIYNGYFEEKFGSIDFSEQRSSFIISFSGTLYGYQPIEIIAKGISLFVSNNVKNVRVRFVGMKFYPDQVERVKRAFKGDVDLLEFTERLPHQEAIKKLNESSVFLLPASPANHQVYAKIFDYMALRKPIILCKSDKGELEKMIKKTNSGKVCNSVEEVAEELSQMYSQWTEKGEVKCNSESVEQFSRRNQTSILAEYLDNV